MEEALPTPICFGGGGFIRGGEGMRTRAVIIREGGASLVSLYGIVVNGSLVSEIVLKFQVDLPCVDGNRTGEGHN